MLEVVQHFEALERCVGCDWRADREELRSTGELLVHIGCGICDEPDGRIDAGNSLEDFNVGGLIVNVRTEWSENTRV